eukprot:1599357-Prymnesium_polylepis.1
MTVPVAAELADDDVLPAPDAGASRANPVPVAARPRSAARDALPLLLRAASHRRRTQSTDGGFAAVSLFAA